MPEHELVYVSGGRQRQNRALAKGLQRVPSAQRYFHASLCLSLPRKRAQRPSEHRFFLIHIERLFRGRLRKSIFLIQPRLLFGGHLNLISFLVQSGLLLGGQSISHNEVKDIAIIKRQLAIAFYGLILVLKRLKTY